MYFAFTVYKHFLFITESSQGGGTNLTIYGAGAIQTLSDLPRVTSESVAGTQPGALTQRRLL